jgi:hypothetical protein
MCKREVLIVAPFPFSAPEPAELAAFRTTVKARLDNAPYCPRCGKWYRFLGSSHDETTGGRRENWVSDCFCYLRQTSDR